MDELCFECNKLLYKPSVLNCGHVCCKSCLPSSDGLLACKRCGSVHPGKFPSVCISLDEIIQEFFPREYAARAEAVGLSFEPLSSGSSLNNDSRSMPHRVGNVHVGVGCDNCGAEPIRGNRYSCMDCAVGYDLCEDCHSKGSTCGGRFNQQHLPGHRMEANNTLLLKNVMDYNSITDNELWNDNEQPQPGGEEHDEDNGVEEYAEDEEYEEDEEDVEDVDEERTTCRIV